MKKLLMHTCCAPCFSYIENDLKLNGIKQKGVYEKFDVTACWYNPNIHPKVEYMKRLKTFIDFCEMRNCKSVIIDEYNLNGYVKYVVENVGADKEYEKRCEYCYYMRLKKVFEYAAKNNFNAVSTTLTISPYQSHDLIKIVGEKLEKEFDSYNIDFIYCDYTPYFREGQKMAREYGLYMQKYCGCIFSIDSRKVGILNG
ncbi:MAG: epoxyqueuosine reductase QueH [Clostridia bacterium]